MQEKSHWNEFPKEFQQYLTKKYGENKWWEATDYLTIAYYQTNEERLAVDFSKYHEAVEKVLGRSVWTHQFASRRVIEDKGMYRQGNAELPTKTQDLCREDIVELVNDAWRKRNLVSMR